jgi:hypothetical protein
MAKNGHALIFVALKGANFTEVETIFDGMLNLNFVHAESTPKNRNNVILSKGSLGKCVAGVVETCHSS